jgi:predicted Fe-Mo cluster-binding NifX family protein
MKVAVSATATHLESTIDPRFGRAAYLLLVDTESEEVEVIDNSPQAGATQGAGIRAASAIAATETAAVISGTVGPKAFATLEKAQIAVYTAAEEMTVREAVAALSRGELPRQLSPGVGGRL